MVVLCLFTNDSHNDVCGRTLFTPHKLQNLPLTTEIEPTILRVEAQCSAIGRSGWLAVLWASVSKIVGSIPAVVRHIFQLSAYYQNT